MEAQHQPAQGPDHTDPSSEPPAQPEPSQIGSLRRALVAFEGSAAIPGPRTASPAERLARLAQAEREGEQRRRDRDAAIAALAANYPDLRVLRRLTPLTGMPAPAGTEVARVAIVDSETAGLELEVDPIIELGAVILEVEANTGRFIRVAGTYESLEDPGRPLSEKIKALTGLTNEILKGRKLDEQGLARALRGVSLLIAHNAEFDRQRIEHRLPWLEAMGWACSQWEFNWREAGCGSAMLEFIAFRLGYFYDAHRALADSHSLARVLVEARAAAAPGAPGAQRSVLEHLIASSQEENYRLVATGAPYEAKNSLKAHGYRWNPELKVWILDVPSQAALDMELPWLRVNVYEEHEQQRKALALGEVIVRVEVLDATTRYSGRPGRIEQRTL